jgi:hypothetical protein
MLKQAELGQAWIGKVTTLARPLGLSIGEMQCLKVVGVVEKSELWTRRTKTGWVVCSDNWRSHRIEVWHVGPGYLTPAIRRSKAK